MHVGIYIYVGPRTSVKEMCEGTQIVKGTLPAGPAATTWHHHPPGRFRCGPMGVLVETQADCDMGLVIMGYPLVMSK